MGAWCAWIRTCISTQTPWLKPRQLAVEHLKKEKRLESVQLKYLLNTSRKYALPLLDYLDKIGITKRAPDNTRYLGPKA